MRIDGQRRGRRPAIERRRRRRFGIFTSITARILAINVLALALLVAGFLYLDQHQRGLSDAKIDALTTQGRLVAAALGESAVAESEDVEPTLRPEVAQTLVRRLSVPVGTRVRLFDIDGDLIVDTRRTAGGGAPVQTKELPPPDQGGRIGRLMVAAYDWVVSRLPPRAAVPRYAEAADQRVTDYPEAEEALLGTLGSAIRDAGDGGLVLTVAVPVQRLKRVQGALLLSTRSDDIDKSVREVRFAILKAFAIALAITVLLSLYFARTIARPVRRLAQAADLVRVGRGRSVTIPEFSRRSDEIGRLSGALKTMTDALLERMDAVERFAIDVAHEIKNPLTSVRSAVETAIRVDDPQKRDKLLNVIANDVARLDRLISDIAEASRLDAQLSRAEATRLDLARLLETLVEVYGETRADHSPRLIFEQVGDESFEIDGVEDQLVQVMRNLIANAVSFSPPDGTITLRLAREADRVLLSVEDEGAGVPPDKCEAIFERFYTLRPEGEKFGMHSGLGLSISKQIVEAHGGTIAAENRQDADGRIIGARLTVRLPA